VGKKVIARGAFLGKLSGHYSDVGQPVANKYLAPTVNCAAARSNLYRHLTCQSVADV